MKISDTRYEVDVTPNRPDLLSHEGLARDLGAVLGKVVKLPAIKGAPAAPKVVRAKGGSGQVAGVKITIEDLEGCPRYCAAIDDLRARRGLEAIDRTVLLDPRTGLVVTNVARFPLPPIDFGTGPFIQEFAPTNYAGTAVIVTDKGSAVKVRLSYPELISI